MTQTLASLNEEFSIPERLCFIEGPGGLPVAELCTSVSTATVCLHGAHVMSFVPTGQKDVLWMSAASDFDTEHPLRGGIPVCWPWFGAHPRKAELPSHGFARISRWTVVDASADADELETRLVLGLEDNDFTRAMEDLRFSLRLVVTIGSSLKVELTSENRNDSPLTINQALHTYFAVGDVTTVRVDGFDGCPSLDTVEGRNTVGVQSGPVRVSEETDFVFTECSGDASLEIPTLDRRVRIEKSGSNSAVVWNPWIAKSARMPDFGDSEYPEMICVETTNARGDEVTIAPGASHTLAAIITPSAL